MADLQSPRALAVSTQWIILSCIMVAVLAVRLITIDAPALDRTAWKEIDYIAISSNFSERGWRFTEPEVSWPADEPRATAMELPVVPFIAALGYPAFGKTPLSVRWVTLVAFLGLIVCVFALARREFGPIAGLAAALAAGALPLHHHFGRFLFTEPALIALSAGSLLPYLRWLEDGKRADFWWTVILLGLAVAMKIEALYMGPLFAWLACWHFRRDWARYGGAVAMAILALAPATVWYAHAYNLATDSLDVFGVFGGMDGGHDKFQTVAMLSDPDWYRAMWARVSWGILGGRIGLALAVIGVVTALLMRRANLAIAYLSAVGLYFCVVAEGQIDAPYRQLVAITPLSLVVGFGATALAALAHSVLITLLGARATARPFASALPTLMALCLVLLIPLKRQGEILAHDPKSIEDPAAWEVAQVVRQAARAGDRIVTLGEYSIHKGGVDLSPVIYYYTGLQGWSLVGTNWSVADIDAYRDKGATLFVARRLNREPQALTMARALRSRYRVVHETEDSIVLDLRMNGAGGAENEVSLLRDSSPAKQ